MTVFSFIYFLAIFRPNKEQEFRYIRTVRKVSSHFEYLENLPLGLDVTWQPVRGDLTVHP